MFRDPNPNVSSYESHPASGQLANHGGRNNETDPTNDKISLILLLLVSKSETQIRDVSPRRADETIPSQNQRGACGGMHNGRPAVQKGFLWKGVAGKTGMRAKEGMKT
jgi:hypothetical protein